MDQAEEVLDKVSEEQEEDKEIGEKILKNGLVSEEELLFNSELKETMKEIDKEAINKL